MAEIPPLPQKGREMLYRLRDAAPNSIAEGMLESLFIRNHGYLAELLQKKGYPVKVTYENGEFCYRLEEGA